MNIEKFKIELINNRYQYHGYIQITKSFVTKKVPYNIFKELNVLKKDGTLKNWKEFSIIYENIKFNDEIYLFLGEGDENNNRQDIVREKEFTLFFNYFNSISENCILTEAEFHDIVYYNNPNSFAISLTNL